MKLMFEQVAPAPDQMIEQGCLCSRAGRDDDTACGFGQPSVFAEQIACTALEPIRDATATRSGPARVGRQQQQHPVPTRAFGSAAAVRQKRSSSSSRHKLSATSIRPLARPAQPSSFSRNRTIEDPAATLAAVLRKQRQRARLQCPSSRWRIWIAQPVPANVDLAQYSSAAAPPGRRRSGDSPRCPITVLLAVLLGLVCRKNITAAH